MIFVISSHSDYSTSEVIDWLIYFAEKYVRVNGNDAVSFDHVLLCAANSEPQCTITVAKQSGEQINVDLSSINSYWYRRGKLNTNREYLSIPQMADLESILNRHLNKEVSSLKSFFYYALATKKSLNNIKDIFLDKTIALFLAQSLGLQIPKTLITKYPDVLKNEFRDAHFVSKAITNCALLINNDYKIAAFTVAEQLRHRKLQSETCFLSLFQQKIDKLYSNFRY